MLVIFGLNVLKDITNKFILQSVHLRCMNKHSLYTFRQDIFYSAFLSGNIHKMNLHTPRNRMRPHFVNTHFYLCRVGIRCTIYKYKQRVDFCDWSTTVHEGLQPITSEQPAMDKYKIFEVVVKI